MQPLAAIVLAMATIVPTGPASAETQWIANPTNNHAYAVIDCPLWQDCQEQAVAQGAHLVTITTAAEQEWLINTFDSTRYYWIGLTDAAVEGVWEWVTGEPVTYTNWSGGEPNDWWRPVGEDYVMLNWPGPGGWNDVGPASSDVIHLLTKAIIERDAVNVRPAANAGSDQFTRAGVTVSLDGSGSSDPDGDYPLSYTWAIAAKPQSSTAALSDPSVASPTFVPDRPGDYRITLVVTDARGLQSAPDEVLVSTLNVPPVADAGPDQAVKWLGSTVSLDGGGSYDEDGHYPLIYNWAIAVRPEGSSAELSDSSSPTPSFVPDLYGEYVISLEVADVYGLVGVVDTVRVSFDNLRPVADPGGNQTVVVGQTVYLDGRRSSDPNGDPLTYLWSIIAAPEGSAATLSGETLAESSFAADLPGEYVIGLIVNDGLLDSEPANITLMVTSRQDEAVWILSDTVVTINRLSPDVFRNSKLQNALTNKISAVLALIDEGLYQDAVDKLENDVLAKMNGCTDVEVPDANDWITQCGAQMPVYSRIADTIALLS